MNYLPRASGLLSLGKSIRSAVLQADDNLLARSASAATTATTASGTTHDEADEEDDEEEATPAPRARTPRRKQPARAKCVLH